MVLQFLELCPIRLELSTIRLSTEQSENPITAGLHPIRRFMGLLPRYYPYLVFWRELFPSLTSFGACALSCGREMLRRASLLRRASFEFI